MRSISGVNTFAGLVTLGGAARINSDLNTLILSNTGTITTTDSTVNLGGSFTTAALGTFNRTGGSVNLVGLQTGNLALDATTGS